MNWKKEKNKKPVAGHFLISSEARNQGSEERSNEGSYFSPESFLSGFNFLPLTSLKLKYIIEAAKKNRRWRGYQRFFRYLVWT